MNCDAVAAVGNTISKLAEIVTFKNVIQCRANLIFSNRPLNSSLWEIITSNIDKVRDFIAKFAALDVEGIMATFSDNAFYHHIPMDPLSGKEALRGFIAPFMEPITENKWALHFIAEDDNSVVMTERVDTFIFGDKRVVMPVMGTFGFENGELAK
ncbi:MAG: limonene-1,2-epoxide hydrolase [Gammaproteobacteria bacterium]|jgi:limonene-1,2-epoxide hydrolase